MGKKKVAVLSKAQRAALRKKAEGLVCDPGRDSHTWRWSEAGYDATLEHARTHRGDRLARAAKAAVPQVGLHKHNRKVMNALIDRVATVRPRLLDEPYVRVIVALAYAPHLRAIGDWTPPGKGSRVALKSLVNQVLGPYAVPGFLTESIMSRPLDREGIKLQLELARIIAGGGSVYREHAARLGGIRLTRRMCHILLTTPGDPTLVQAVRRAQVLGYGGGERLARALDRGFFGRIRPYEPFWSEVIHWLCRQDDVRLEQIDPVCDYLEHERIEDREYSIAGRTWPSVVRRMREWHDDLAAARRLRKVKGRRRLSDRFTPSGFSTAHWNEPVKKRQKVVEQIPWSVTEILTVDDLVAEGRAMRHCVGSYAAKIRRGEASIWSLACRRKGVVTIEVNNRTQQIVQARGKANRLPDAREALSLRYWAEQNRLAITCYGL